MSQTMNSAPKNVPEQRTYKVEDVQPPQEQPQAATLDLAALID